MTEKKDWWERRRAKQDMLRAYSKEDYIMNMALAVFLSFMMYFVCISKSLCLSHMKIPLFVSIVVFQMFVTVVITPVKYLKGFDAKLGLNKNWINTVPVNAVFMNVFHVLPQLFISAGMMTLLYNQDLTDVQNKLELFLVILKSLSVDFILSMTFFSSIVLFIARNEENKRLRENKKTD